MSRRNVIALALPFVGGSAVGATAWITGGARWWVVLLSVWALCFVVTVALMWAEQREWAEIDDAGGN